MQIVKPNFTAWFVMQGIIAAMHQPEHKDSLDETSLALYVPISRAAEKTRLLSHAISKLPYAVQYKIGQLVTDASRLRHYMLRKKVVEEWARDALGQGTIEQVVILGAGLDVLSLKLSSTFKDILFIEVDTNDTQRFKEHAYKEANVKIPHNVELLAGDLRHPLHDILSSSTGFKKDKKTLWIAEGLLMFIPEEDVTRLFASIQSLSSPGSSIVFTTLSPRDQGSSASKLLQKLYLVKENSPILWTVARDKTREFAKKTGCSPLKEVDFHELHKSHKLSKCNKNKQVGEDIHMWVW